VPTVRLLLGQSLRGEDKRSSVSFADGTDHLQLSSDNRIHNIRLHASPDKRAIFNDPTVDCLGRIELRGVTTTGRVQILARDKMRGGHVDVNGLDRLTACCWHLAIAYRVLTPEPSPDSHACFVRAQIRAARTRAMPIPVMFQW
jgi:hypothetical protein